MNILKPIIERRVGIHFPMEEIRYKQALTVCNLIDRVDKLKKWERSELYSALRYVLAYNSRLALYLPFDVLKYAPEEEFRNSYKNAWKLLLRVEDVRENFHLGDCLEMDARPPEGLERVVKCIHLLPWLMEYGYFSADDLVAMFSMWEPEDLALQNLKEILPVLVARGQIRMNSVEYERLCKVLKKTPDRKRSAPLYSSKKREEWLREMKTVQPALTPEAKLEGPFSDNIPGFYDKLMEISEVLEPNQIVLVGGSRLKGYAQIGSDLDVWEYSELLKSPTLYPGSCEATHIYLNSIWLGGKDVDLLAETRKVLGAYAGEEDNEYRKLFVERYDKEAVAFPHRHKFRCMERLESDLLQYRLLHKGFSRVTGKREFETSIYPEIDGDCPFYDDEYRRIATKLYAKYVFL